MQTRQGSGSSITSDGENVVRVIPRDGGQIIVDKQGGRTVITTAQLPPDVWRVVRSAEETAIVLMSILAAIFILGPFARMFARRVERKAAMAPSPEALGLRQQIEQLQQSVDAMCIEVERISESQRFQSKLLLDSKGEPVRSHIS